MRVESRRAIFCGSNRAHDIDLLAGLGAIRYGERKRVAGFAGNVGSENDARGAAEMASPAPAVPNESGVYYIVHHTTNVTVAGRAIPVPSADVIRKVLGAIQEPAAILMDEQVVQIQRHIAILLLWNDTLNLTSVTDPLEILTRHFGEALIAAPFLPQKGRLADVGSGAGFPGLALKIFQPNLQVLLIEQNTKKTAFLNEAIRFLSLTEISVHRADYQALDPTLAPFDVISARALGSYRELANWALPRLSPDGKLILWLGEEEAAKLSALPEWRFAPPTKIPDSRHRLLLLGHPAKK